jgi:hypothetical protein
MPSPISFTALLTLISRLRLRLTSEHEVDGVCSTHVICKCIQYYSWKTWRDETWWKSKTNGGVILSYIVKKLSVRLWIGLIWLKLGIKTVSFEHTKPSVSIRRLSFFFLPIEGLLASQEWFMKFLRNKEAFHEFEDTKLQKTLYSLVADSVSFNSLPAVSACV